jgi:hypothetical protein
MLSSILSTMLGGRARFCDSLSFDDADALPPAFLLIPEEEAPVPVPAEEVLPVADAVFEPVTVEILARAEEVVAPVAAIALAVRCGESRREYRPPVLVGLALLANEHVATVERIRGGGIGGRVDNGG